MNTGWLTAYEARTLIGNRRQALTSSAIREIELSIVDNARTILPARCTFMSDKTLDADGMVSNQVNSNDVPVPCWVWNLTDDWHLNWNDGTFHLSGEHEGEVRYLKLVGVRFDSHAIEKIWPAIGLAHDSRVELHNSANANADASEQRRGGAQPKVDAWHAFWFEAMKMLNEGELQDTKRFPTQSALVQELLRRIDDALSEPSVKPWVSRIWREFRR